MVKSQPLRRPWFWGGRLTSHKDNQFSMDGWMEMVVSNYFPSKGLIHHPIETTIEYMVGFRVPGSTSQKKYLGRFFASKNLGK